ncbi:MAG: SGNH/GDSL hydrolase family protein [Lachnospiraceae bacterium]
MSTLKSQDRKCWAGKKVLCLGDSLTQAGIWTERLHQNLQCQVTRHCGGGLKMTEIIDGGISAEGEHPPLHKEQLADKDIVIFFAGYNDRGKADGVLGDLYDPAVDLETTIAGALQYCINRIYDILRETDNLTCKILIVTPHCVGTYSYIPQNGYEEYPAKSGRTVRTLAHTMEIVARENSLPVCNLWETSGINRHTWRVYGAHPYEDQVHCSVQGYELIGDLVTGAIQSYFGW